MEQLSGKTAVITGAGSGIGRAVALALADEGMHVVVADIEQAPADETAAAVRSRGVRAIAVRTDVTDEASVDALVDAAYEQFGSVDVLHNNAGVLVRGGLTEMRLPDWQWVFSVNVFGVANCIRAFVPRMLAQGTEAHVVNTASSGGFTIGPHFGVYGASKFACRAISEVLRLELDGTGIGVSTLCPSAVTTQLHASRRNRPAALGGSGDPYDGGYGRRPSEPADVAALVVDGIKRNLPYVFTDPGMRDRLSASFQSILDAIEE